MSPSRQATILIINQKCHMALVDMYEILYLKRRDGMEADPEQMGYESAILNEVEFLGYKYSVIEEARFRHLRPLGLNHRFYEFGASMHTLGYHPAYALGRFAKYFSTGAVTGRLGALYMIYYYLTYKAEIQGYNRLYDAQFRQYVRKKQIDRLKRILNMRILRK